VRGRRILLLAAPGLVAACALITGVGDFSVEEGDGSVPLPDAETTDRAEAASADDASSDDAVADADASQPCAEPGLVALWRLDEGSGDVVHDCTANHHDGHLEAGAWVPGIHGGALSFDGGFASFGRPPLLAATGGGSFTVTLWVRHPLGSLGANAQEIVSKTLSTASGGWRLGIAPGAQGSMKIGGTDTQGGLLLPTVWKHLASVFHPGTAVEVYVDGALVGVTEAGVPDAATDDGAELRIGARGDGQFFFIGAVDEVRIYGRALSGAEIATLAKP
jgi:hypothetical protein